MRFTDKEVKCLDDLKAMALTIESGVEFIEYSDQVPPEICDDFLLDIADDLSGIVAQFTSDLKG